MLLSICVLSFLTLLPPAIATTTSPSSSPAPKLRTATLHALPCSPTPSSPKPLAVLAYHPIHPHLSKIENFTPPSNTSDPDSTTQVAIYMPSGSKDAVAAGRLRTSATATNGFHAPYKGRFRITVNSEGDVVGATWHSYLPKASQTKPTSNGKEKDKEATDGRGDFDIVTVKPAPGVVFDTPAKGKGAVAGVGPAQAVGTDGEEEVVEKTFLQKYWWLLIGVAVLAMSGTGGDK